MRLQYQDITNSHSKHQCFNCGKYTSEGIIIKGNILCNECSPMCIPVKLQFPKKRILAKSKTRRNIKTPKKEGTISREEIRRAIREVEKGS